MDGAVPINPKDVTIELVPGDRYPTEVKAQAIARLQQGFGTRRIERDLKALYDGIGPDHSTIAEWRKQAEINGTIRTQSEEIILRAGELIDKALDKLHSLIDGPEVLKRSELLMLTDVANRLRGTAVDKDQREREFEQRHSPAGINVGVYVVVPASQVGLPEPCPRCGVKDTAGGRCRNCAESLPQ